MGDDDARPPLHQRLERLLDRVFGDRVERARRLVEDQDLRILQNHARDREPLLLPAGELQAAVAHDGFITLGLVGNEVRKVRDIAGRVELLLGRVLLGIEQVVPDRAVEEIAVLGHDADLRAEIRKIKVAHVHARHGHAPAEHVVQTRDQVHDRRLAGAGGPDDRVHLPAGDGEIDVPQQLLFRVIGKAHVLIDDVGVRHVGLLAVFGRLDRIGHVEVFKNAREERERARKVHMDVQKALHRAVEPVDQRDRGRDRADGQPQVGLGNDEIAARKVDQQRTELGEHAHHDAEPPAAVLLAKRQLRDLLVHADKALVFLLLAGKELDEQRAGDGERLVDELVHLVVLGLGIGQKLITPLAHALRRQNQQRDHDDADDRELPAHRKERDQRRHDRGDV